MEKSNVTFVHLSLFNCSRTWKSEKQKGENPVPNNDEQLAITLQTVIFCSFHTLVRRPEYVTDQTRKECLCTLYVPTWLSGIHVTERSHRGDIGSPISSSRSPWGYNRSVCMMRKWEKVTQLGVTKPAQLTLLEVTLVGIHATGLSFSLEIFRKIITKYLLKEEYFQRCCKLLIFHGRKFTLWNKKFCSRLVLVNILSA